MKERYVLLVNEDKTWNLVEGSSVNGIKDDGKDFAIFHINSETSGSKIAGLMKELFPEKILDLPMMAILSGMSLQEMFIEFLKSKKQDDD